MDGQLTVTEIELKLNREKIEVIPHISVARGSLGWQVVPTAGALRYASFVWVDSQVWCVRIGGHRSNSGLNVQWSV